MFQTTIIVNLNRPTNYSLNSYLLHFVFPAFREIPSDQSFALLKTSILKGKRGREEEKRERVRERKKENQST